MRELRENEDVKKEAQDKGISKGEMQVWLSKKGGETWAVMSAEEKKVRPLQRDLTAGLLLGYSYACACLDPFQKYNDRAAEIRTNYDAWKTKQA